jgi:hypothetical protein
MSMIIMQSSQFHIKGLEILTYYSFLEDFAKIFFLSENHSDTPIKLRCTGVATFSLRWSASSKMI